MYKLDEDMIEQKDLAGKHADKLRELVNDWEEVNGQMQDPIF